MMHLRSRGLPARIYPVAGKLFELYAILGKARLHIAGRGKYEQAKKIAFPGLSSGNSDHQSPSAFGPAEATPASAIPTRKKENTRQWALRSRRGHTLAQALRPSPEQSCPENFPRAGLAPRRAYRHVPQKHRESRLLYFTLELNACQHIAASEIGGIDVHQHCRIGVLACTRITTHAVGNDAALFAGGSHHFPTRGTYRTYTRCGP